MHARVDRPEQELNTAGVYAEINERLARLGAENALRLEAMQRKLHEAQGTRGVGAEARLELHEAKGTRGVSAEARLELHEAKGTRGAGVEARLESSPVGAALMERKAAWPLNAPAPAHDVLEKGAAVLYRDTQSGAVLEVTVTNVHYDDTAAPYYSIRLASGQERETVRERLWRKVVRPDTPDCEEVELSRTLGPLSPGVKLGWGAHAEKEHLVLGPLSPGFQLGWAPRRAGDASELVQNSEPEIYMPARKTAFRQDRLPAGCSGSPLRGSPTRQLRR